MRRRGRSGTSSMASSEPTCSTELTVSGASAGSLAISSTWPLLAGLDAPRHCRGDCRHGWRCASRWREVGAAACAVFARRRRAGSCTARRRGAVVGASPALGRLVGWSSLAGARASPGSRLRLRSRGRAGRLGLRAGIGFGLGLGLRFGFFLQQRLPVGDRDLVVVGMDFAEGQEAVTIAAVVDEGRLQRRLDPRDLGEIDIAAEQLACGGFVVELLYPAVAQHHDPSLLRVRGIDEHLVLLSM